jgi:uncharacterized membrane protein
VEASLIGQRVRASVSQRWVALRAAVTAFPAAPLFDPPIAPPDAGDASFPQGRRGVRFADLLRALATPKGQRRLAWGLVILSIILDILVVGQHALVRHFSYHTTAFDLGNMDQAVWNTLHGHFFRFTNRGIDWFGPPTRLGIHIEPILLLIAPLYLIHSGAETLLVLQTFALALGALPLMALSLRRLPDLPLVGVGFVAAYLLAPELLGEALWDFHPVTLATPLLLAALYALDVRRYGWFLVAGVLAAACKEDVALALVPLGLLIAVRDKRLQLGLGVTLGSVAWTALCFLVIIPHFNDGASSVGNAYWYRYTALGSTPAAALRHVATDPLLVLANVATPDKLGYLALLLRTGGGLGLFAPLWWTVGLPELAINLLSAQPPQYSGFYHYNAVLLPTLLASAIYGTAAWRAARLAALSGSTPPPLTVSPRSFAGYAERLVRWWTGLIGRIPVSPRLLAPVVVVWLLVATGWNLASIGYKVGGFWRAGSSPAPHQARIDALLRRIPPNAVVAASDTIDPHLSDRETIYLLPDPLAYRAQYVAVDLAQINSGGQVDDIRMFDMMVNSGHYRFVGTAGSVVVIQLVGPPLGG